MELNKIDFGLLGVKSAPKHKIITEAPKRKHEESTLQQQFCQQVRKIAPTIDFVRHEREKSRSLFMGSLMGVFNSLDGIADWECLDAFGNYHGMYIEFKKPGTKWLMADGITVKKEYTHQYLFHQRMWNKGRPAYFCNDLLAGLLLLRKYTECDPYPMQEYKIHPDMLGSDFIELL
jgi:hypothetical protein